MNNIELKVKIASSGLPAARRLLKRTNCRFIRTMRQVDTYFRYPGARLKLRDVAGRYHELIFYRRPNTAGSRMSTFSVARLSAKDTRVARRVFSTLFGVLVIIRKRREFWRRNHTRIFLDTVERLGTFIELETVVRSLTPAAARREHQAMKVLLGLDTKSAIGSSYSTLLLQKRSGTRRQRR